MSQDMQTAPRPAADAPPAHVDPAPEPWTHCHSCGTTLYVNRLRRELAVCPDCGHHHRLSAAERIELLMDEGSWEQGQPSLRSTDPLDFSDSRPYRDRLDEARNRTGLQDAVLHGVGSIGGRRAVLFVMDFQFLGGSMGAAVGETVVRAAQRAIRERLPLLLVTTSGGARMQEGALSLMQMAKTAQAIRDVQDAGILTVGILCDPTFGGVTASFATLPDILVAEKGALIGFAGPRVIASATREPLPAGFQTADRLHELGLVDVVETRRGLRAFLARLLDIDARRGTPADAAACDVDDAEPASDPAGGRSAGDILRTAREISRPTTLDYIEHICEDFVELHGDRLRGDDAAVVAGPALLDGRPVMIVGHQKGHDTGELIRRNFGMPHPEGYRKVARLARLADRLGIPLVALVDTQGAAPGVSAEENGQAWAIADCIATILNLSVPVVSVITGEGGSGGALALATANRLLMMQNSCYSVISPESCSTILHGNPSRSAELAEALRITPVQLRRLGIVDDVIPEPPGGAQADSGAAAESLHRAVSHALSTLGDPSDDLRRHRHDRFRAFGEASVD